jgi:hypothetical protein
MVISVERLQTCFLSLSKILKSTVNVTWFVVLHRDLRIMLLGVVLVLELWSVALAVAGEFVVWHLL